MVRGDNETKEHQASAVQRVERFLSPANRHLVDASTELSEEATYVVPGRSWVASTVTGREEMIRHFEQTFDFALRESDSSSSTRRASISSSVGGTTRSPTCSFMGTTNGSGK